MSTWAGLLLPGVLVRVIDAGLLVIATAPRSPESDRLVAWIRAVRAKFVEPSRNVPELVMS